MFATLEGTTVKLSADIARSLAGVTSGYKVELHDKAMSKYTFMVELDNADAAHRAVLALCKREGKHLKQTGATIQRIN